MPTPHLHHPPARPQRRGTPSLLSSGLLSFALVSGLFPACRDSASATAKSSAGAVPEPSTAAGTQARTAAECAAAGKIDPLTGAYSNEVTGVGLPAMETLEFVTPATAIAAYRENIRSQTSFKMSADEISGMEQVLSSTALTIKPRSSGSFLFFHLRVYSPPEEVGDVGDEELLSAVIANETAQLKGSVRQGDDYVSFDVAEPVTVDVGKKRFRKIVSTMTHRDHATSHQVIFATLHRGRIVHLWGSYRYTNAIQRVTAAGQINAIVNALVWE